MLEQQWSVGLFQGKGFKKDKVLPLTVNSLRLPLKGRPWPTTHRRLYHRLGGIVLYEDSEIDKKIPLMYQMASITEWYA